MHYNFWFVFSSAIATLSEFLWHEKKNIVAYAESPQRLARSRGRLGRLARWRDWIHILPIRRIVRYWEVYHLPHCHPEYGNSDGAL
jgi:hypothetical protein